MTEPSIHVVDVVTPEGVKSYVALTSSSSIFSEGLIAEEILGVLKHPPAPEEPITPDNFVPNSKFARFLADVIAIHAPGQAGLRGEAQRIGKGYVFLFDQRTPTPDGPVPPEDILGAFTVQDGAVVPGSYVASPNHRLLTANGFFRLDRALMECLERELAARRANRSGEADRGA